MASEQRFYAKSSYPNEKQCRQLCRELGLDAKQIKFWFQNKRTLTKAQGVRADSYSLYGENERIQRENLAMQEALENAYCPACGGPPFGVEEKRLALQNLQMENVQLKEQIETIARRLPDFPLGKLQSLQQSSDFRNQVILGGPSLPLDAGNSSGSSVANGSSGSLSIEKSAMIRAAINAISELLRLLRVDEPLWIKSLIEGRHVLQPDSHSQLFPTPCHFQKSATQVESSKDSALVAIDPTELLKMFVDPDKWVDLFPTIVTKARTVEVLDTRKLGDHTGSLQLMYEQMHILSPLVEPREFYFLRYCGMVESGLWVMVDVSYDWSGKDPLALPLRSWKLPSGCLIQDKGNGCCEVTWLENVKAEDSCHRLYRDLVCGAAAFGAQRWVATLLRMTERLAAGACSPSNELGGGIIDTPEKRRRIMNLSQRMVKNFCRSLSMTGNLDFPHVSELNNNGVHISVRRSSGEHGQPPGKIVTASASLWLPLSCQALFDFFRDVKLRAQWDVLDNGSFPVASISCGTHPGNCISITLPIFSNGSKVLTLQENCTDPSGSLVVFAPLDLSAIQLAMEREDSTKIPILPSGFVISPDGRRDKGKSVIGDSTSSGNKVGSLLTMAFQILDWTPSQFELNMESVSAGNTLVRSTIQKITSYFGSPDVDMA